MAGPEKRDGKQKATVRVIETTPNVPLPEMVTVPEGEFIMGTSDEQVMQLYWKEDWAQEWHEDGMFRIEQPQHYVYLPSYEIGKFPVTNDDYYRFVWQSNYKLPKGWIGFRFPEGLEKHPVVGISWVDATAYCEWLGRMVKREYRLATEAEWERAARGIDARMYPWGQDFDPWRCNTLESGIQGTSDVNIYVPAGVSQVGCVDMVGNVFEWTSSRLLPYPFDPEPSPHSGNEVAKFVVRGGAWYYSRKLARCASREGFIKEYTSPAVGFRIARSID
jgi:toxoflavin biosynthesis protein ToxD